MFSLIKDGETENKNHTNGEFAKIWWKKTSRSETWMNIENALGKHRVKKALFEWKILVPCFIHVCRKIILCFSASIYRMQTIIGKYNKTNIHLLFYNWFCDDMNRNELLIRK